MVILGLDLATRSGWCFVDSGRVISSGVQDFSKRRGESNGIMFLRFRKWLFSIIELSYPGLIAYERAHFRGAGTEILVGLQTHTMSIAAELGIETVPVHTAELKKFSTGSGRAGKDQMVAAAAKILGRPPLDDNEADAVLIALWAEREFGEW
jgi:Holliday junction resolvasome RuvABC endonuclease subunit